MAQSQSIKTDLPFPSFSSFFARIRNRSNTRPYQQFSSVRSNSARVPSKNGGGGMKKTKSIRTCAWWLLNSRQLLKLLAQEVLVPDIKAAEDLNFGSFPTTPATFGACSPLHAPHQPFDLTPSKLIVFPIWRRKPKVRKPVAAIVVQVMGNFNPEVFQSPMFCDVICICLS